MTDNTAILVIAKQLLGITDASKDNILATLIDFSIQDAIAISNNIAIGFEYGIIARMATHLYVVQGAEHITKQSLAGVSEDYTLQYPANVMNTLKSYRKLKLL